MQQSDTKEYNTTHDRMGKVIQKKPIKIWPYLQMVYA